MASPTKPLFRVLSISIIILALIATATVHDTAPQGAIAAAAGPAFQLPWPIGQSWIFTNGPHEAWGAGTPWGALDFQPPSSIG
ncbi:MAG: hypothetical protein ABIH46_07610 [Chloroflexota bacterium]